MNEKTYLPFFMLLNDIKKEKIKDVIKQKNSGRFTAPSSPLIKKLKKKTTQIFPHFDCMKSNVDILVCTGEVENINQATELYEKYQNKITLEWQFSFSPDIMSTLPKLKININRLKKYFFQTFCLLKNICSKHRLVKKKFNREYKKRNKFLIKGINYTNF